MICDTIYIYIDRYITSYITYSIYALGDVFVSEIERV